MPAVPSNLTDALANLQADSDALASASSTDAVAAATLASAQAAKTTSAANVVAAQGTLASDLAAFEVQLGLAYGPQASPPPGP